jgi:hypothetical protein
MGTFCSGSFSYLFDGEDCILMNVYWADMTVMYIVA